MTVDQDTLFRLIEVCRDMGKNPKCDFGADRERFLDILSAIGDDFATKQYLVQRQILEDARKIADDVTKDAQLDKAASDTLTKSIDSLLTNPQVGWGSDVEPTI